MACTAYGIKYGVKYPKATSGYTAFDLILGQNLLSEVLHMGI